MSHPNRYFRFFFRKQSWKYGVLITEMLVSPDLILLQQLLRICNNVYPMLVYCNLFWMFFNKVYFLPFTNKTINSICIYFYLFAACSLFQEQDFCFSKCLSQSILASVLLLLRLWPDTSLKSLSTLIWQQRVTNVSCLPIGLIFKARLRGFKTKIANFWPLHCLAIPRDLSSTKTKPNIEIWPEILGNKCGLFLPDSKGFHYYSDISWYNCLG